MQSNNKSNDLQGSTKQTNSFLAKAGVALFGIKPTPTRQAKPVVQQSNETLRTPYKHPWCRKKAPCCYGTFDTKTFAYDRPKIKL